MIQFYGIYLQYFQLIDIHYIILNCILFVIWKSVQFNVIYLQYSVIYIHFIILNSIMSIWQSVGTVG